MDRLFASAQAQQELQKNRDRVEIFTSTTINVLIEDNHKLESVLLHDANIDRQFQRNIDGIFVYMGHVTQTDLFKDLIELNAQGYIETDEDMGTSLPGVYAAGDIVQKKYWQITTAMNDGTVAALSAAEYIRKLNSSK